MPKLKTVFVCSECGYESPRWLGRCSSCMSFNTMNEEISTPAPKLGMAKESSLGVSHSKAVTLKKIDRNTDERAPTNIEELDRVLSGGLVTGSLTLVGGEPGIGKSTLLLQICQSIAFKNNGRILYVSGEESLAQIKMRAERLGVNNDNLFLLAETDVMAVEHAINEISPSLIIVDSIQTMQTGELSSSPGSVTQIRECASFFMRAAKNNGISVVLVGHVTKEGSLAGPRLLEHMVDTVLYFEGERAAGYRVIRAVKNRFGATNEIGVFEMDEMGLKSIENPSEYMLSGRPLDAPGSAVTCCVEGTRPILAEVQALVSFTTFGTPRRVAAGLDYNRSVMLIAMLEKRAGIALSNYDSYLNIAGGMKITEPAVDLATVAAIASSSKNKPINPYFLAFGEVGLTGEVRAVGGADKRIAEAEKLGFKECAVPQANMRGIRKRGDMRIYGVSNVNELLSVIL